MMELVRCLIVLPVLAAVTAGAHTRQQRQTGGNASLDDFVDSETSIALTGALNNVGGLNSSLVEGADPGIVVASPSKVNPDYFFTWTRDSALTYLMIIDELLLGNTSLQKTVEDYTTAQAFLQTVDNPSGSLYPVGDGLGEPKSYTNKTRFDGTWGRPQRDGPGLRATALMEVANALLQRNVSLVKNVYWPIIYNDLLYVGQYWNQTGYDLWEEVHGSSFFTIDAQHRALSQGAMLAEALNMTCEPCQQAPQILCFLQNNFWNETGGYLTADANVNNVNRSGINTDPILASIHVFDVNGTCDGGDYQPCNSKMLATHKVVVDAFRDLYPINNNASAPEAVLVGRYPEDTYYDGNPWPLCTLACAELLYDAVAQFEAAGQVTVDQYSLAFFQDIYPDAQEAVYVGDPMKNIIDAMLTYADGFVSTVQQYLPANGSISEQFNKTTGESISASKLTWSFASFVTMARRRAGKFPPSWGANSTVASNASSTCMATSYNATGEYKPAKAAGAPSVDMSCKSEIVFTVNATTEFGQNIFLVGNTTLLGGLVNNESAIILPMNPGNYTTTNPEWYVDIWLPADEYIHYQYVLQNTSSTSMPWVFENVTRVVMNQGCGWDGVVLVQDVASFPGVGMS